MGRPALVDNDGAGVALGEPETARGEFTLEPRAVARRIPGVQRGGSHVVQGDPGSGFHQPFARRRFRDRGVAFEDAGGEEPGAHVGAALALGAVIASPGEGGRRRWQAELEGDQVADVGPACVVVVEVDQDAVVPHDAVDAVLVVTAMLRVLRADVRLGLQAELGLKALPEKIQDGLGIDGLGRRVHVHVVTGLPGPVVSRAGNEFPELRVEIAARDDAARGNYTGDLVGLGFEQVSRKRASAGAAGAAGDHGKAPARL